MRARFWVSNVLFSLRHCNSSPPSVREPSFSLPGFHFSTPVCCPVPSTPYAPVLLSLHYLDFRNVCVLNSATFFFSFSPVHLSFVGFLCRSPCSSFPPKEKLYVLLLFLVLTSFLVPRTCLLLAVFLFCFVNLFENLPFFFPVFPTAFTVAQSCTYWKLSA